MPFAVGAYELIIGCLMFTFPQVFGVVPRSQAFRLFSHLDMSLVTGGIFTLMSVAVSGYRSGAIPTGFAAVGILPMLISTLVAARIGSWMVVVVNATMVLGVLVDVMPLRTRRTSAGARPGRSIPTLAVVMAIIAVVCGGLLLVAPEVLRVATYRTVRSHSLYFGGSMVAAAVALVVGWFLPRFRTTTQVAAAFSVLAFAAGLVAARAWLAALAFGLLASFLAAEPVLSGWLKQRAAQRASQPRNVSDYEIATESVAWGFALLAALIASVDSGSQRGLGLAFLAFGTGMFTLAWFHLRSADAFGPSINVIASGVYSVLGVILVQLTGGADSPYFFVYFLPIIALAWTQTPQAIVVPLTIPLSALLAEIAVDLASGPGAVRGVFLSAIPRAVGLILTSGFTYLLARRNLESRVRARDVRRQLEAVLAHMGEGLITTDQDGRVILCNPAAAEILGCKDRDCQGQFLTEMLPLRRADGIALGSREHPVRRALEGQRVSSECLVAERPQGALPVEVTATPFVGSNGGHGAIVLLRDASADVDAERMRNDFFFIASHELRTPLTVMKGNLEMAMEALPPPALRSPIEEALRSTSRLIRLVNDFLDAARLDHGAVSLRLMEGHLPDVVRQAMAMLQPEAVRRGLALTYEVPDGLPAVRMDPERTLQILINLIGNSIRHTQQGGAEISHVVDGKMVETVVKDSGVGIAREQQDRLFARFGQVERGLTRSTGGSGLGLYISRKLAEQMGGALVLKASAPGQGSTFALRLAAAEVPVLVR